MIESTLITYLLNRTSAGTDVYAERPGELPDLFIVLEKTSGMIEFGIYEDTIAIQSVSTSSLLQAITLDEEVIDAILGDSDSYGIVDLDDIISVEHNTTANFTDPETKEYRYQSVFVITHY